MATTTSLHADVTVNYKDPEALVKDLVAVVRELVPRAPWTDSSAEITHTVISGGITNLLYTVNCAGERILVRVFGEKTEVLIDREKDNAVFRVLSDLKFGPHYYGTFNNGRVEGWFEARPLEPAEMGHREPVDMPSLIAPTLAHMHSLETPFDRSVMLWTFLDKWAGMATAVKFDDSEAQQKRLAALDLSSITSQLDWLKTQLPSEGNDLGKALLAAQLEATTKTGASDAVQAAVAAAGAAAYETVFCHNDLLSGNILYIASEGRMQAIDFEYGGYNFAAFDIANHFCEYAGFDFDLDKWFPTDEGMVHFLRHYMQARVAKAADPSKVPFAALAAAEAGDAAGDAFYGELLRIVKQFTLASHLFWGLWAVIQARHSPIEFDFLDYARLRFGGYAKHKAQYFASAV